MEWTDQGRGGAVAAATPEAITAGINVLRDGGNAVDAAIAAILALSVTDYGMFSFGGELPFMFYSGASRKITVLSGQGAAPLSPEAMTWYAEHGIPSDGSLKSSPVPAVLDLCTTALNLYGTISFERAVLPTLSILQNGREPWHARLLKTLSLLAETERQANGERNDKLERVRHRFYEGDLADRLEAYYIANGSFLRKLDLENHKTIVEDPVSVHYRGHAVYKCGPWTQGPSLCQALRLLESFDLQEMGHLSDKYIHLVAEALKLAFADRDAYYADPRFTDVPVDELLSSEYTDLRRELIDMERASHETRPGNPRAMRALCDATMDDTWVGGTTTCVASDRFGNVVSATPSANPPYHMCEELGIAHGNRLRCLNTAPGHPNRIEPGKRPRITLTPTLVVEEDGSILAVSVAGGDLQDQTTLNCLLNHLDFGMSPAEAVAAPRFGTGHHESSFRSDANRNDTLVLPGSLWLNHGIKEDTFIRLEKRGHVVQWTDTAIAKPVMLYLNAETRMSYVAGDPRARRYAQAIR